MSRRAAAALDPSQLGLFDAPLPLDVAEPGAARTAAYDPAPHVVPTNDAAAAPLPATPQAAPTPSVQSTLAPAVFRHPQATREIVLAGGHRVAYLLKRARRRSIGFVVGLEGLAVSAPRWVGVGDIESALHEKANWILKKLREQRERAARQQAAKVEWRDGASFPFLGETVIVVLDGATPGAVLHTNEAQPQAALAGVPRLTLHVGLPHTAAPEQIRDTVQSWLQRQARRVFDERCRVFAERLGVRFSRLALSSAQTRWGSASADGSIRLNWRLIHFALATIDYVVAHELAHLREMNHSPRFWDVVRSVLPDYEAARGTLRSDVLPVFE